VRVASAAKKTASATNRIDHGRRRRERDATRPSLGIILGGAATAPPVFSTEFYVERLIIVLVIDAVSEIGFAVEGAPHARARGERRFKRVLLQFLVVSILGKPTSSRISLQ
jgi:hypothetical protein